MEQKDVIPRHNKHIFDAIEEKRFLDHTGTSSSFPSSLCYFLYSRFASYSRLTKIVSACEAKSFSEFAQLKEPKKVQCITANMRYLKKMEEDQTMVRLLSSFFMSISCFRFLVEVYLAFCSLWPCGSLLTLIRKMVVSLPTMQSSMWNTAKRRGYVKIRWKLWWDTWLLVQFLFEGHGSALLPCDKP